MPVTRLIWVGCVMKIFKYFYVGVLRMNGGTKWKGFFLLHLRHITVINSYITSTQRILQTVELLKEK